MTDIVNGVLVRGGQVLMAHRAPGRKSYPNCWSFPGGHVEAGETLAQALVRELDEEIGVLARSWTFLHRFADPAAPPARPVTYHLFVIDAWDGAPRNIGDEHSEVRWVALAQAAGMRGLAFETYVAVLERLPAV